MNPRTLGWLLMVGLLMWVGIVWLLLTVVGSVT